MPDSKQECKDFAVIIPLTRGFHTIIDIEDYGVVSKSKWKAMKSTNAFYAYRRVPGGNGKTQALHRMLLGVEGKQRVDHRNGNTLDNRRGNIRIATQSQNNANQPRKPKSPWPFKGVRPTPNATPGARRIWTATIRKDRQYMHIGSYETIEEAAKAYDDKARELYGEFACVNFPREGERQA